MPEDNKGNIDKKLAENIPEKIAEIVPENKPESIANIEQLATPEINAEIAEQNPDEMPKMSEGEPGNIVSLSQQRKANAQRAKEIEKILEKDLDDIYLAMPQAKRLEFKNAGEKAIAQVNGLIEAGKLTMKKLVDLIRSWLAIIPGVNKFFLEQETKIKADKIMKINNDHKYE